MLETLGYNKNNENRQKDDFYATPPMEVFNILKRETLVEPILEPCCGEGHMVTGIEMAGYEVIKATDLIDRGYGETGLDFLSEDYPYKAKTIIMNPPFKLIGEFVQKALTIAEDKVIMLARMQFLEGVTRYETIFKDNPPNRVYVYVDRILCPKDADFTVNKSSSMCYAWFVWDKNGTGTSLTWIRRMDKK